MVGGHRARVLRPRPPEPVTPGARATASVRRHDGLLVGRFDAVLPARIPGSADRHDLRRARSRCLRRAGGRRPSRRRPRRRAPRRPEPTEWDPRIEADRRQVADAPRADVRPSRGGRVPRRRRVREEGRRSTRASSTKEDKREHRAGRRASSAAVGLIGPDVEPLDARSSPSGSRVRARVLRPEDEEDHGEGNERRRPRGAGDGRTRAHARAAGPALRSARSSRRPRRRRRTGRRALHMLVGGRRGAHPERLRADAVTEKTRRRTGDASAELGRASLRRDRGQGHLRFAAASYFQAPYELGPSMLGALIATEQAAAVDGLFARPAGRRRGVRHAVDAARPPRSSRPSRRRSSPRARSDRGSPTCSARWRSSRCSRPASTTRPHSPRPTRGTVTRCRCSPRKGTACVRATFAGTGPRRYRHHHRRREPLGRPDAGGVGDGRPARPTASRSPHAIPAVQPARSRTRRSGPSRSWATGTACSPPESRTVIRPPWPRARPTRWCVTPCSRR